MKTRALPPGVLLAAFLLCGCGFRVVHNNVARFADAVTLVTENSKAAFETVDRKYVEVEADKLAINYEKNGFNPRQKLHLLEKQDLQVRLDLLDALQEYASTLSQLSSDETLQQFDDQTQALGKNLQALTGTAAFKSLAQNWGTKINVAATAIDTLGRWFIERKRHKQLPGLVAHMQAPVKSIAELLQADIGDRPDEQGSGGSGLRSQLWNEYMEAMLQQSAFIDHNKDRLDPVTKSQEIRKLPQLLEQRNQADDVLRQTAASMAKLVQAHDEILRALRENKDFHAEILALISEGERVKAFYQALQK